MIGIIEQGKEIVLNESAFSTNLIAYWKLATNANDSSVNTHNGVNTGVTFDGEKAQFGTGKYITIADSDDFSFTDNSNDIPFAIALGLNYDDTNGNQQIVSKRGDLDNREWQILSNGTDVIFRVYNPSTPNSWLAINFPISQMTSGLNTIYIHYTGGKLHTDISAYLNGNNSVGTTSEVGTYTGMSKGNSNVVIGAMNWDYTNEFKGKLKDLAIWKNAAKLTGSEITELDYRVKNNISLI